MKQKISENITYPEKLESLFHDNKEEFTKSFLEISEDYNSDLVKFWKVRLTYESQNENVGFQKLDLLIVIILFLFSGVLVKIPNLFPQIDIEFFNTRNLAIIVFNGLILFTFWQNKIFEKKKILFYSAFVLILLVFINFLPFEQTDSVILALIHSPLFLWCLFGLAFISFDLKNTERKIKFIRFNGELLIMTGLLLISGGLFTAITLGLFNVININIEKFYFENVALIGAVYSPVAAYFLINFYPNITSKISPVIARVFTPFVLVTLIIYLITMIFSDSKILEDRNLLIIFNVLLLAVMAIIIFSISELNKTKEKNINILILFTLAVLALVINSIALAAIITRVSYGLTPNRTAVLISNILIFINLILIAKNLLQSYYDVKKINSVESTVAKYLTIYWAYTILIIFIFPFVFGMK